jgi:methylase of polypeptide subunit release factors
MANLPYVEENFLVDEYVKKEPSLALFAQQN